MAYVEMVIGMDGMCWARQIVIFIHWDGDIEQRLVWLSKNKRTTNTHAFCPIWMWVRDDEIPLH
jgi:hypothetical protein